jgi:hypothetical protein
MKTLSLTLLLCLLSAPLLAQEAKPAPKKAQSEKDALAWETDEAAAFKRAADEKKQVFIYFWHGGG